MSTFFGLHIGASALNAFQVAVNTTANNIANIRTEGYSRQTTTLQAKTALRVTARYGSAGTGVEATSIQQQRDSYYDTKYWGNNSSLGRYEQKLYYLDQIQTYFKDDSSVKGFSTVFGEMFSALDTLKTDSAELSKRNQFINKAQSLCTYFNSVYQNLSEIQTDCNEEIKSNVDTINSIAEKISLLNKEINQIETGTGANAATLRDERANLLDQLSKIVDVSYTEYEVQNTYGDNLGGTNFTVYINGETLVDGKNYRKLECVPSKMIVTPPSYDDAGNLKYYETKLNQTDNDGNYYLYWKDTGMDFSATAGTSGGSLKGLFEMRDGDNGENFRGTITAADEHSFTVTGTSVEDLNALNLPAKDGVIKVNDVNYKYDSWEAEVDSEGNLVSVKFNLSSDRSVAYPETAVEKGYVLSAGAGINEMGIPYYMAQINEFIRNFSQLFNEIESTGQDLNGDKAPTFFEGVTANGTEYDFSGTAAYRNLEAGKTTSISSADNTYYRLTGGNYKVNQELIDSPSRFGATTDITKTDAYDVVEELKKLQSETTVYRGDKAESFLETLLSDISVDTEKATTYYKVYSNLETTISLQRTSVSGVDEDEEGINMMNYQNAYNMASKIISVMQEMLDKLINETGV